MLKKTFFINGKSTDAIGRCKIDYSQSSRVKKINEYITKSGNQVMSHAKSHRTGQLCIRREVVYKRQESNRKAFFSYVTPTGHERKFCHRNII